MLKFSFGNKKLSNTTAIFNLPAGYSCPFAYQCKSFADRKSGRITDTPHTEFRCYAAMLETRPNVRKAHWHNFDKLKDCKSVGQITDLLAKSLPEALRYRIHSSGDFYSQDYFDSWLKIARLHPDRIFYAYTKAIPFWIARLNQIPKNFRLVASYGGTHDNLIVKHNLKYCKVFPSKESACAAGLPIDTDDSLAWSNNNTPFALIIHGTQPKGSLWAKAWHKIKKEKQTLRKEATCSH